jgi:glucoamylase
MWAHAEYIKLLRSHSDGRVFDRIAPVAARYLGAGPPRRRIEVWKPTRRVRTVRVGTTLRIQAAEPFRLRWTKDGWAHVEDSRSVPTGLGIEYVDLESAGGGSAPFEFTFFWVNADRWAGRNYTVDVA